MRLATPIGPAANAFLVMWVGGTVGGFFSTLLRSIPLHYQQQAWAGDRLYAGDLFLRYGYLVWLVAYYLVSNLPRTADAKATRGDVLFDILQTLLAFVAAYALGFVDRDAGFKYPFLGAFIWSNWTILVISLLSVWFDGAWWIRMYRGAGAVVAAASLGAISLRLHDVIDSTALHVSLGVSLLLLFLLLVAYWRFRIDAGGGDA